MKLPKILLTLSLVSLPMLAHAVSPAEAIEARKAVFKDYKKVFGQQMGDVVKGKAPYNKDEFAALAKQMEALSKKAWSHFPANSEQGDTNTRPEVWSKPAVWQAEIDTHEKAAAALAKTAASASDLAQVRPAFGALQKTCKSCHDQFKKD